MRPILPVLILLSAILTACASKGELPAGPQKSPNSAFRVDPTLLGEATPGPATPATSSQPVAASVTMDRPIKLDPVGLRTQRSVYFDLNSARLKADYTPALRDHGIYLRDHPQARIRIEGNADERGTAEHNQRLGMQRADSVRTALLSQGARPEQISIKTLGASNPKKTGHDEASWAENRRSDVVYEREY